MGQGGGGKKGDMEERRGSLPTHVVFGRIAPLLHVHDFHVQHSPKLHLDPAEVMHRSVRRAAAAAPDKAILHQGREITTFIAVSVNNSAVHYEIRSLVANSRLRSAGYQSDQKLINSPFEPVLLALGENTHGRISKRRAIFTLPTAAVAGQRRAGSG